MTSCLHSTLAMNQTNDSPKKWSANFINLYQVQHFNSHRNCPRRSKYPDEPKLGAITLLHKSFGQTIRRQKSEQIPNSCTTFPPGVCQITTSIVRGGKCNDIVGEMAEMANSLSYLGVKRSRTSFSTSEVHPRASKLRPVLPVTTTNLIKNHKCAFYIINGSLFVLFVCECVCVLCWMCALTALWLRAQWNLSRAVGPFIAASETTSTTAPMGVRELGLVNVRKRERWWPRGGISAFHLSDESRTILILGLWISVMYISVPQGNDINAYYRIHFLTKQAH